MEHLISVQKQGTRGLFQMFSRTTRMSAIHKQKNNDVYKSSSNIAETSPRGHPDPRRGCPNPPHAGKARWNPNCVAEAKEMRINETKIGDVRETRERREALRHSNSKMQVLSTASVDRIYQLSGLAE